MNSAVDSQAFRCSAVIPAHNESAVIATTLTALRRADNDVEIVVVCNGCTDNSAAVAHEAAPTAKIIETAIPSKVSALNLGDVAVSAFPRVYLDADIRLSAGALDMLMYAMSATGALIASPAPRMDFEGCSWLVRSYYRVWLALPYCRSGLMGTGVYALSREGRARFGAFPDVIADDVYVRSLFAPDERLLVEECQAIVRAPRDFWSLIKIKTRSRLGVYELQLKHPQQMAQDAKDYGSAGRMILQSPALWLPGAVYLAVNLITRVRARWMYGKRGFNHWERDLSRRGGAG